MIQNGLRGVHWVLSDTAGTEEMYPDQGPVLDMFGATTNGDGGADERGARSAEPGAARSWCRRAFL